MSTTLRWSPDQEQRRLGYVEAGLEPRLFRWWVATPTEDLVASLAAAKPLAEEYGLDEYVTDLEAELAYRGHPHLSSVVTASAGPAAVEVVSGADRAHVPGAAEPSTGQP